MKKILIPLFYTVLLAFMLLSCVPYRKYQDLEAKRSRCDEENSQLRTASKDLETKNTELNARIESLTKQIQGLTTDTVILGKSLRNITRNYDKLNDTYELLLEKNKEYLQGNRDETERILAHLQETKEDLIKKEDELKKLERELEKKEASLRKLAEEVAASEKELDANRKALEQNEAELIKLRNILNRGDSVVKALKDKVSDALFGFKNKGLTVEERNGKVYVSMEEKLLFASGSYAVGAKGIEALKELAKILEENKDVNVLVEGHTDNVPYIGQGALKDNWDLSVMRATAIVKILVTNSTINPQRLAAAGRSEYLPIDPADTDDARRKNRRTEIILTPKLDELLKILNSN